METVNEKLNAVNVCPGPNITNFSKVVSLQVMTDHIYGRKNILANAKRPHMFITELHLYIDYLKEQLEEDIQPEQLVKKKNYYTSFYQNLKDGIKYYQGLTDMPGLSRDQFVTALAQAEEEIDLLNYQYSICKDQFQTRENKLLD